MLATPALAALKVIAENSVHGKPVVEFLSPEGVNGPEPMASAEPGDNSEAGAPPEAIANL